LENKYGACGNGKKKCGKRCRRKAEGDKEKRRKPQNAYPERVPNGIKRRLSKKKLIGKRGGAENELCY
jgi:hypothetical protein